MRLTAMFSSLINIFRFKLITFILITVACTNSTINNYNFVNKIQPKPYFLFKTKLKKDTIYSESELKLIKYGLVDINKMDSTIIVDMKYATKDNFMGWNVYGNLRKCFLQPDVAEKLVKSQQYLKQQNNSYTLKVLDCARPQYVQQIIFDSIKLPQIEKMKYVSNPKKGSLHNFGAAVDITIFDIDNNIDLDMGTKFDCMDEKAQPIAEQKLFEAGILNENQINNRKLLRASMYNGGFYNIQTEWWHFNSCSRDTAITRYKMIP